jgi:hypothetical protein
LAAGLLVMIVQSGDEPAKRLPQVAQRTEPGFGDESKIADQPSVESLDRARRELKPTPAPAASPPATATAAPDSTIASTSSPSKEKADRLGGAMPTEPRQEMAQDATTGTLAGSAGPSRPAGKPAASAGATSGPAEIDVIKERESVVMQSDGSAAKSRSTKLDAKLQQPADRAGEAGTALGSVSSKDWSKALADERKFLVVQVVATPEAFKNKSFDELLQKSGIKLAPRPEKSTSLSDSGVERYAKQPESVAATAPTREPKAGEVPAKDLVLVEGSKAKVESLLAALKNDTTNFVRIDTSGRSRAQEGAAQNDLGVDKSVPNNFSAYNRNEVKSTGRGANADFDSYYVMLQEHADNYSTGGNQYGIEVNGGSETPPANRFDVNDRKPQSGEATATRVDWLEERGRQLAEARGGRRAFSSADEPAKKLPELQKKVEKRAKQSTPSDTLKVLFVLSPNPAAVPSAQPASAPK